MTYKTTFFRLLDKLNHLIKCSGLGLVILDIGDALILLPGNSIHGRTGRMKHHRTLLESGDIAEMRKTAKKEIDFLKVGIVRVEAELLKKTASERSQIPVLVEHLLILRRRQRRILGNVAFRELLDILLDNLVQLNCNLLIEKLVRGGNIGIEKSFVFFAKTVDLEFREDKEFLSTLHLTDPVTRLNMLKLRTIETLKEQKVFTIEDLVQLEPVALMPIGGIDVDDRDLLLDITQYLFNGAYDNLHG